MAKKIGLGRGLDSLLGSEEPAIGSSIQNTIVPPKNGNSREKQEQNILKIDINTIVTNPNQPRKVFKEEELKELADSIRQNGLLQPIIVKKVGPTNYELIAGERRLRASKIAELTKIPVIINDIDEENKLEIALIENIQREDLNPMEEALCYKQIIDKKNVTQAELANMVSKARSTITNTLRLLELPISAQKLLQENQITPGHARAILSVTTELGRKKLLEKIVDEKLTVREAEQIANLYCAQTKALKTVKPSTPKSFKKASNLLRQYLKHTVKVKKTKSKNKIEIEFQNEEDLERLLRLIIKEEN